MPVPSPMILSMAFRRSSAARAPQAPAPLRDDNSARVARRRGACRAAAATVIAAGLLVACATQDEKDANTPVEKLYADAMDEATSGNYDRAIKQLDRIEGKAAGSILAQQAQLELAYLYWKTADKAQALATLDRFI